MPKRPSDFDLFAKDLINDRISRRRPSDSDINEVFKAHQLRSPKAKAVDEGMTKNVTNIKELWFSDPARYDFFGVDTKKAKPKKKGKGKK